MSTIQETVQELLTDFFEDDQAALFHMAEMARRFGVLDAIVSTQSTDPQVLGMWLYNDKDRIMPLQEFVDIVIHYMPILEADGLLVCGVPTDHAVQLSQLHLMMLNETAQLNS